MIAGLYEGATYEGGSLRMEPGDGLLLYTDGVTEAFDSAGEMFDSSRLTQNLETKLQAPVEEVVKSLISDVKAFVGPAPQSDDITVMAVRYLG